MQSPILAPTKQKRFPSIRPSNHRITSGETVGKKVTYNCVAWAANADTQIWWQAGDEPGCYWPSRVLGDDSLLSYEKLFEFLGYRQCDSDKLEIAYEKIAIYSNPDGFQHVAYQLFRGWTSKLGNWEDIWHKTLSTLEGGDYGTVWAIMKRRSGICGYLARACFRLTAKLWPLPRP